MKLAFAQFLFLTLPFLALAQNAPIDFEEGGFGADWTWTVFENADNPPLEIIANPDPVVNTSSTVAKFTAREMGAPFAGCESEHATDLGIYTLSAENSIVTIMVWKSVVSDVGIKLVTTSGGALPELKVANTLVEQWEQIVFDFSGYIDNAIYAIEDVDQIVVFPDFESRTEERIIYFDNITISSEVPTGLTELESFDFQVFPNPSSDHIRVSADQKIDGIQLINSLGQVVLKQNVQSHTGDIQLTGLEAGSYLLEAELGESILRRTVVVQ